MSLHAIFHSEHNRLVDGAHCPLVSRVKAGVIWARVSRLYTVGGFGPPLGSRERGALNVSFDPEATELLRR